MDCNETNKLSATMEDYLEAIWVLKKEDKVARVKNISVLMDVTPPTVHSAMTCLKQRELVQQESYGYIELTPEGEKIAKKIQKRHELLSRFLSEVMGVDHDIAEDDACKLEHNVSRQTLERIMDFLSFLENSTEENGPQWLKNFHKNYL